MRTTKHLALLLSILALSASHARAQETAVTPTPPQEEPASYRMELIYVLEDGRAEFVFIVGKAGFKSVAALKRFVGGLPAGTTLEWAPGCVRMGGEPLLSCPEEMEDFKRFCDEQRINFVLVPSG